MPRKLRTFTTTVGFFDLAIAAPSMKAALEAWGSNQNLFKRGFAKETDDPAIVAATMAHPGAVLRRAVGTDGEFSENADLPKNLVTHSLRRVANATGKEIERADLVRRYELKKGTNPAPARSRFPRLLRSTNGVAPSSCSTRLGWGSSGFRARKRRSHRGCPPITAALLGMLTGIGGGLARDILVAQIPTVLRADIYAVAALTGAVVIGQPLHVPHRHNDHRCAALFRATAKRDSSRLAPPRRKAARATTHACARESRGLTAEGSPIRARSYWHRTAFADRPGHDDLIPDRALIPRLHPIPLWRIVANVGERAG
jgi:glycine transporter